jgi:hypothetical protein
MNEFPISFYLNQKYAFDILAILDNGFTDIRTLKTSANAEDTKENKLKGEVGVNNVFAFLGVTLGGEKNSSKREGTLEESEFSKVHTPNSLFAKVRTSLHSRGLVRTDKFMDSTTGEFVEFKATLRKNPVIDNLESYLSVFRLALNFEDKSQGKAQKQGQQNNKKLLDQFQGLVTQLQSDGNLDLIGEHVGEEKFKAVLTIDNSYLNDPSLNDLADGEFTVFGKVIKVLPDTSNDSVNLLRKTSLSKVDNSLLTEMFSGFQNMAAHGLKDADFIKDIKPPVIQVVPISIFA